MDRVRMSRTSSAATAEARTLGEVVEGDRSKASEHRQSETSLLTSEWSSEASISELRGPSTRMYRLFLLIGLFATSLLGLDQATNRYLQNKAGLNGIFIITLRSAAAFIVWVPFFPRFIKPLRGMNHFWLYCFLHTINPVLNTYATKYTVAYISQTIKLTSPFFVVGISYLLKYPIPRFTMPALVFAAIGGFMTIAGDFTGLQLHDAYGSLLALSAAFCFACNTLLYWVIKKQVPSGALTLLENVCQFCVIGAISFSIDDWTGVWKEMDTETIIVLCVTMASSILGSFLKIAATRVISAPLFSALSPWQLVVVLAISVSPFLDDHASIVNILGCVVVTITLACYLYNRYLDSERARRELLAHLLAQQVEDAKANGAENGIFAGSNGYHHGDKPLIRNDSIASKVSLSESKIGGYGSFISEKQGDASSRKTHSGV